MKNSIHVIKPRWEDGALVFDDPAVGLVREPFVAGADVALGILSDFEPTFTLLFSDKPFPGHQAHMERRREEHGGNWYWSEELGFEGWLCPALFKYFDVAPDDLYLEIRRSK